MSNVVLVTGGTGYIGSHVAVELLSSGYEVVLLDDLRNSDEGVVLRIGEIAGSVPLFECCDVCDTVGVEDILRRHDVVSVIHCAGVKSVSESVIDPLLYYRVNVGGSLSLIEAMVRCGVSCLLYSSSALVYGEPDVLPLLESSKVLPLNPYGCSKSVVERVMLDMASGGDLSFCSLRYFNPIGSHGSGLIGDSPIGAVNNLLPLLMGSVSGGYDLRVFGSDYGTRDGSCIRDYLHVVDLARGHVLALDYMAKHRGYECFNLGSERGYSVFEIISGFESFCGESVSYRVEGRRLGDVAELLASSRRAYDILGWSASLDLGEMLVSAWNFHCSNLVGAGSGVGSGAGSGAGSGVGLGVGSGVNFKESVGDL